MRNALCNYWAYPHYEITLAIMLSSPRLPYSPQEKRQIDL